VERLVTGVRVTVLRPAPTARVDVRGRETVVRLGVLRLDTLVPALRLAVTDLERLGAELRVDTLGAMLRLAVDRLDTLLLELRLGATDLERRGAELRVDALGTLLRLAALRLGLLDRELELAAARLLLLLLELPLLRELLAPRTGAMANARITKQNPQ
jgi:hypothetical protein